MITEKAWHYATRDWVAGCILDCIKRGTPGSQRETSIYSLIMGYNRASEEGKVYPSWPTMGRGARRKFIEISLRALIRRGQVVVVGTTDDYRAEGGITRLYELGTVLDRLAKAVDLPLLGDPDDRE